jgi:hypothetical protein
MRAIATTATLAALPGVASAHVADIPILLHAIRHGWILLAIVPLLVLLLPPGHAKR